MLGPVTTCSQLPRRRSDTRYWSRQQSHGRIPYYLTRRRFSVNCIFLMASIAQIVVPTEVSHRLRVSPAGSGVFLRPVSARPFARAAPPRHRSARRPSCSSGTATPSATPNLRDIFHRMVEYRRHVSPFSTPWSAGTPRSSASSESAESLASLRFRDSVRNFPIRSPSKGSVRFWRSEKPDLRSVRVGEFPVPSNRPNFVRQPQEMVRILLAVGGQVSQNAGHSLIDATLDARVEFLSSGS